MMPVRLFAHALISLFDVTADATCIPPNTTIALSAPIKIGLSDFITKSTIVNN